MRAKKKKKNVGIFQKTSKISITSIVVEKRGFLIHSGGFSLQKKVHHISYQSPTIPYHLVKLTKYSPKKTQKKPPIKFCICF